MSILRGIERFELRGKAVVLFAVAPLMVVVMNEAGVHPLFMAMAVALYIACGIGLWRRASEV